MWKIYYRHMNLMKNIDVFSGSSLMAEKCPVHVLRQNRLLSQFRALACLDHLQWYQPPRTSLNKWKLCKQQHSTVNSSSALSWNAILCTCFIPELHYFVLTPPWIGNGILLGFVLQRTPVCDPFVTHFLDPQPGHNYHLFLIPELAHIVLVGRNIQCHEHTS